MAHASLPKLPGLRLIASMPRNRRRSESPVGPHDRAASLRRSNAAPDDVTSSRLCGCHSRPPRWSRNSVSIKPCWRIGKNAFLHIGHEIVFANSMNRSADNSENTGRVASLLDQTLAAALQDKQTVT
jgi:hypothetical protein